VHPAGVPRDVFEIVKNDVIAVEKLRPAARRAWRSALIEQSYWRIDGVGHRDTRGHRHRPAP
jgi:hypothetical protein